MSEINFFLNFNVPIEPLKNVSTYSDMIINLIIRFSVEADDIQFTRNSYTLLDTNKPVMMKFIHRN